MRFNWLYDKPYTRIYTVREQHIDALGHTNNNIYSQWCEETAWRHSAALGLDASDYQRMDRAMAIQKAEYQYQLPSFDKDTLVVGTWLTSMHRKLTMERRFQIFNQHSGELLFQGLWQLVCIKLSTHKPVKMPQQFIDSYSPNLANSLAHNN